MKNKKILDFLAYFKNDKSLLFIIFALVLTTSAINVAIPFVISFIIDDLIKNQQKQALIIVSILTIGGFLVLSIMSYYSTTLVGTLSQRILNNLRKDLFLKIQSLPLIFFVQNTSGDIISRLNNDTRKLDNFLSRYVFEFAATFFTFLGIGLFVFYLNVKLAILTWLGVLILIIFSYFVGPHVAKASKASLKINGDITTYLNDNISNYKAVVAFDQQEQVNSGYANLVDESFQKAVISKILTNMFRYIYNFAGILTQGFVLLVGVSMLNNGEISTGVLLSFVLYTQRFYEPLVRLAAVFGAYQQAFGAWSRVHEVFELDASNGLLLLNYDPSHLVKDIDE
ncbi:MAG: ABC transporter transmembrane domain-containing protein [Patescibacteria group bacterium]